MSISSVSAALQDALEKGDVVELEQAIVAAEDAMHVSPHSRKSSSSLGNLITRAKDMYLVHMDACRPYVKPLRKACKELNERGIFEALVRARGAPDEVQLCMYTDLCNAESLRHEIVAAQKVAVQLLDATNSEDVDNFLSECSPFLEDRTILSLVQKREDLLREEKRRLAGHMTPLRSAPRGGGGDVGSSQRGRRDPLEDMGRYELEDEGASPVHGVLRNATPSHLLPSSGGSANRHLLDSDRGASTPAHGTTASRGGSSSGNAVPAAYPAIRYAMYQGRDSGLQRAVAEGASPWMQAMRSLRQHAYDEVVREEKGERGQLEDAEMGGRALLYRLEMVERIKCWVATKQFANRSGSDEDECETLDGSDAAASDGMGAAGQGIERMEERRDRQTAMKAPSPAPTSSASWVRLPAALSSAGLSIPSLPASRNPAGNTPTRVYAHSLSAYPLRTTLQQHEQQPLVPALHARSSRAGTADGSTSPSADGAILGGAVRARLASAPNSSPTARTLAAAASALQNTPRMSRDTPNISPIKEASATSGAGSMWEQEPFYHRGEMKAGWAGVPEGGTGATNANTNTTTAASSSSMVATAALELRRIQARLRAVLQEEDIHRRDIEGTEDFDRNVFLFPVSARIAMLQRTAGSRLRIY
jgi:hypothetical protein